MDNIYDRALTALENRTLNRNQWLKVYGAYRCALRTYNGSNTAEAFVAEGLLSHELGEFIQNMRHVQRRTGRMCTIGHKRHQIRVKLHHAATSH